MALNVVSASIIRIVSALEVVRKPQVDVALAAEPLQDRQSPVQFWAHNLSPARRV